MLHTLRHSIKRMLCNLRALSEVYCKQLWVIKAQYFIFKQLRMFLFRRKTEEGRGGGKDCECCHLASQLLEGVKQ